MYYHGTAQPSSVSNAALLFNATRNDLKNNR
jgi:hypothetical protein